MILYREHVQQIRVPENLFFTLLISLKDAFHVLWKSCNLHKTQNTSIMQKAGHAHSTSCNNFKYFQMGKYEVGYVVLYA